MTAIVGLEHGLAYTIVGPDGTRAVLNDTSDPDFVGFVDVEAGGVTGLERAGVRESADVLPEADGGVNGTFRYDRLAFTIAGIIPPDVGALSWLARQSRILRVTNAMGADAAVQWAPSENTAPVRVAPTNLVTNPSFELDLAGYANTGSGLNVGAVLTQSPSFASVGAYSGKVVTTAALANEGARYSLGVLPAGTYSVSLALRGDVGGEAVQFIAGAVGGGTTIFSGNLTTAFSTKSGTFTSDGVTASHFYVRSTGAAALTWYMDAALVVAGAVVPAYGDGDTPGYAWDGVAHSSTSGPVVATPQAIAVRFRQQQPTRLTGRRPKRFLLAGVSEFPGALSVAAKAATLNPSGTAGGGFASLLTSPLGSDAANVGAVTAVNDGTIDTWPTFTLTGPAVNPYIYSATLDRGLYFNYTLAAGESLVISTDPRARTILLNGTGNRYSALDTTRSQWFPLKAGSNDLRIGYTSYSAGATLAVAWNNAFG